MELSVAARWASPSLGSVGRLGTLQDDLQRSGRHLGVALALGSPVAAAFWTICLLLFVSSFAPLTSGWSVWVPPSLVVRRCS